MKLTVSVISARTVRSRGCLLVGIGVCVAAAFAFAAPPAYKVVNKIKIGGATRWDYAYVDSANHRLYVSHTAQTEVIDTTTDKLVGTIPDTRASTESLWPTI